jgi:hypothetical protein
MGCVSEGRGGSGTPTDGPNRRLVEVSAVLGDESQQLRGVPTEDGQPVPPGSAEVLLLAL